MAKSTHNTREGPGVREPAPHDERTDVKLAGDWLDRWLMELDQAELRTYLQLAHFYNTRTYHDQEALSRILPARDGAKVMERLERRGLLEVVRREGRFHYHFPHRGTDGFHRAEQARPSLADALAFQERMTEELFQLTEQDETAALRDKLFKRYPQLKEEYDLYQSAADESAPRWRLWMEVSRLLIREFELRFGSLREDHGELFKEVSSKVLRHHLDVVDGVVAEVLERLDAVFPEVHQAWVMAPSEEEFVGLPFVRRLAQRYGIGAEQMLINTIEALGAQGKAVVSVDENGALGSMILPSDTGLTKSEERVLFLKPEERARRDSPRNQERVRRARNKYANYLIDRAVSVLADFVAVGRVRGIDPWLERIVDLVNDALSLLPMSDGRPLVQLEHVIDRFDALRQGARSRPAQPADDVESLDEAEADAVAMAATAVAAVAGNGRHAPGAAVKTRRAPSKSGSATAVKAAPATKTAPAATKAAPAAKGGKAKAKAKGRR